MLWNSTDKQAALNLSERDSENGCNGFFTLSFFTRSNIARGIERYIDVVEKRLEGHVDAEPIHMYSY